MGESAQLFVFFEHLITHYSIETVIAATMNNIAPRADKTIQDFSTINMWYNKLDEIYNLAFGPVLAAFSSSKQLMMLKRMEPPFLDDYKQHEDEQGCINGSCLSGKDIYPSPHTSMTLEFAQAAAWL